LEKLVTTENSVEGMKQELINLQPQLEQASEETEKKMVIVERETIEVEKVVQEVAKEEAIAQDAADKAKVIRDDCEEKLNEAMPILNEALKSLEVLSKNDITNLKTMMSPVPAVKSVMEAICILKKVDPPKRMDPATS
jgi:dynein heavy chain